MARRYLLLELEGHYLPTPTPFTDDGSSISEIRLARWLADRIAKGTSRFLVGGDAGEFGTLTFAERKQLLDRVLRNVPAGTSVVAHISALSTSACIDLSHHAAEAGAKSAILMPPYYGRYSDSELRGHFLRVAQLGRLPLVVVDPFARIGPELRQRLHEIPEVRVASRLNAQEMAPTPCFERSCTDEFALGSALASPLLFFGWPKAAGTADSAWSILRRLIHDYGSARVFKAASEQAGLELGPLRGPTCDMPRTAQELLYQELSSAA